MKKLFYIVGITLLMLVSSNSNSVAPATFHAHEIEERIARSKQYEFEMRHEGKKEILSHFSINLDNEEQIFNKLDEISDRLSIESEWLLLAICKESRANPKAVNKFSKATGIIQWLPSTANDLNTSIHEIYNMDFIDQLDLVEKYFNRVTQGKELNSYGDLYLAIFYPRAIGKSDCYIIGKQNSLVVKYNYAMSNGGIITVKDAKSFATASI